MIKLIASDLDGTLLYQRNNSVSEEMFDMIREMKERGIIFAAATGRQYHNLKKLFAPVWEDMAFICENGAAIFYKDQLLEQYVIPKDALLELIHLIDSDERTEVLVSSANTSYVRPKRSDFVDHLTLLGNHVTVVKEWEDIEEPCIKVAWYEKGGVENRQEHWRELIKPPAKVVTSGAEWLDILFPDCNKGVGMKLLQKHLALKTKEIVAFGDNDNDAEMLKVVGYPIAMKNGKDAIKALCPYETSKVEDTVRQILDGEFPVNEV